MVVLVSVRDLGGVTGVTVELGQFRSPHVARVFLEETTKNVGRFYLVSMPEVVKWGIRKNMK